MQHSVLLLRGWCVQVCHKLGVVYTGPHPLPLLQPEDLQALQNIRPKELKASVKWATIAKSVYNGGRLK